MRPSETAVSVNAGRSFSSALLAIMLQVGAPPALRAQDQDTEQGRQSAVAAIVEQSRRFSEAYVRGDIEALVTMRR